MKSHKSIKAFADELRNSDEYWVERVKIEFVEGLARQMQTHSISRAQLAEKIGASAAYITKALRGETNFTIETMVKLARAVSEDMSLQVTITQVKGRPASCKAVSQVQSLSSGPGNSQQSQRAQSRSPDP